MMRESFGGRVLMGDGNTDGDGVVMTVMVMVMVMVMEGWRRNENEEDIREEGKRRE